MCTISETGHGNNVSSMMTSEQPYLV